jgi:uncharacterized protein (TIGR02453 family)
MSLPPAALRFLRALKRNNRRAWFEAHREDWETAVRAPLRALVEELDVRFARFAPETVADPKRSLFRIHRDIRFSADKSPYKTHAACWFHHRAARRQVGADAEQGSAGFYFHHEPGASFVGGGLWMPPRLMLLRVRDAMADDPTGFARIATDRALRRRFGGLDTGSVLTRSPRGYSDDLAAQPWLRYRSFTMGRALTDAQMTGPRLAALLQKDFLRLRTLVRWLNQALGLPPARRR